MKKNIVEILSTIFDRCSEFRSGSRLSPPSLATSSSPPSSSSSQAPSAPMLSGKTSNMFLREALDKVDDDDEDEEDGCEGGHGLSYTTHMSHDAIAATVRRASSFVLSALQDNYRDLEDDSPEDKIAAHAMLEQLLTQLEQSGFTKEDIHRAFIWFLNLLLQQGTNGRISVKSGSTRIFLPEETAKIGEEGLGFIVSLEHAEILNFSSREIVLTQLMQLPQEECSMNEIRWVVLMVLLSHNDRNNVQKLLEKYSLYLM